MSRNGKRSDVAPPGWLRWVAWALGLAAVVGPLLAPNDYWIGVMARICLYATLALGLNVVVGFAGLLVLAYVPFFVIGSFRSASLGSGPLVLRPPVFLSV